MFKLCQRKNSKNIWLCIYLPLKDQKLLDSLDYRAKVDKSDPKPFLSKKFKILFHFRCGRPQASGYELASQNDLNEDLLEDDDDFEVTEATLQFNNEAALLNSREANA